jgi:hypothetical protein
VSAVAGINSYPDASARSPAFPGGGGSTAALQAQILRDQCLLADWSSCVSAKTSQGQAQIQAISGRLSAARARMARIEAAQATAVPMPAANAKPQLQGPAAANPLAGRSAAADAESAQRGLDVWA